MIEYRDRDDLGINWGYVLLAIIIFWCIFGCGQPTYYSTPTPVVVQQPAQQYQIIQDPNTGMQYATFYDGGVQMMIDIATWNSWYALGGYSYVVNHYHSYPRCIRYNSTVYGRYTTVSRGSYNTYRPSGGFRSTGNTPAFRSTSPSRAPTFRSTTIQQSRPAFRSSSGFTPSRSSTGGFRRH